MNNADYGLTLQKMICDEYHLEINEYANAQFAANYNKAYESELKDVISEIFKRVDSDPKRLLTYSQMLIKGAQTTSPHNFLLDNDKTLSIRTTKTSDKVSPRTVGQAGFPVLNEYFADIYGGKINNQEDVRKLVFNHIHEILPIFIDHLFQSDYTVMLSKGNKDSINVIKADELMELSFSRDDFEFTRDLSTWTESTTLKYHGKSIAEIQTHKERTFKFRFLISSIPEWIKQVKINNETLGISAESAVCEHFDLEQPKSFASRVLPAYVEALKRPVADAFTVIPAAIKHSGSDPGNRGKQSKSSYDFVLSGDEKLSLKTNKNGDKICPPEVGQPSSETCLHYFSQFFEPGTKKVTGVLFKKMVFENIEKIMPIYVDHLFDSDWLLWIYKTKDGFEHMEINRNEIRSFNWEKERFSFTKHTVEEWINSNTVKYDGVSIGEFQVHQTRGSFVFRFNIKNLLKLVRK